MDFKSFLKDAYGYNAAFIVINQLYKQSISLLYFKTITIKNIARLYIIIIYCLTSDSDPCWAHADYSLYTYREKTLFKKTP